MKKIIGIIAISSVCIVAGCSKKTEEASSAEATAEVAAADATADAASAADASVATEANAPAVEGENSAVQTVQNPEEILAVQQSALEKNRQLVKSSQVRFEVDELQKTTQAIEKKLLEVNGYIEVKQIDYQVQERDSRNKLDGTIDIFEKVKPVADLTIRVPNENVTTFLNGLIPLIKNFDQQYYEAKRYEFKLLEEQIRTAQQSYGESRAVSNQLQRLTRQEVQDRLKYSTISLSYYQAAQLRQSKDLNLNRIANIQSDPFFTRVWDSIKMGFIAVREIIVWLMILWPLYLILAVGYWGYRAYKKKFSAKKM